MDIDHEYPLKIGLLLKRHGRKIVAEARVKWASVFFAALEEEPILRIVPSSSYFQISPAYRALTVKKGEDVFVNFKVRPIQLPGNPSGICNLSVDFEYRGEVLRTVNLDVQVQHKFSLGPFKIPRPYWRTFGVIGGTIGFLDGMVNVSQLVTWADSTIWRVIMISGIIASTTLLLTSILLWRRAGRRVAQKFSI